MDEDLETTETAGYRAPAQKSLQELAQLDQGDQDLARWKASLGVTQEQGQGGGGGSARLDLVSFVLESQGRPDLVLDLAEIAKGKMTSRTVVKEGEEYRLRLGFRIQGGLVVGLKYLQSVKRGPLRVDKSEFMLGSYGPKGHGEDDVVTFRTPLEEAPSGLLARGDYTVRSILIDDDKNKHLDFEWTLSLKKDWT